MSGVANSIQVPFIGIDFEANLAGLTPDTPIQALIMGQKLAAGTGTVETKYVVSNADEVAALGGIGSHVHKVAQAFFKNTSVASAQVIMLADAGGSAAATQPITLTGPATAAGEIVLYVNGQRIAVSVANGDNLASIGAAVVAAINAELDLAWTAAFNTPVVTLTARNKGPVAGDLDFRINYNAGESLPAGVTVTAGTFVPGTTEVDVQDVIDAIGDTWFNVVAMPYNDATNLGVWQEYAADQWKYDVMKDAVGITCKRDTRANLITLGSTTATYNSKHVSMFAWYKRLESVSEGAGALAGAIAESVTNDPGMPLHRIQLAGISALATGDRWTMIERNQLLQNGIATLDDSVGVQTYAVITMYLKNGSGVADPSYQQVIDVFKRMASRYRFRVQIALKYPRARLADTAESIASGYQVITPSIGRDEALIWYKDLIRDGIAENYDAFKAAVVCRRSTVNMNRLEWILPENLINSFIVGSATIKISL